MRTTTARLAVLPIVALAAACAPLPEDDVETTAQEIVIPFAGNDPVREGVVLVTRAGTRCTGAMLDAVTVLTGGACIGARAADFRVQLGSEVQTVDLVRFSQSGVAILELRRPFAALPLSFTRRLSPRTATTLNGHELRCFGYTAPVNGAVQFGSGIMAARPAAQGFLSLQGARVLTSFERSDQGTVCLDIPSGSTELDAMVLSVDAAGVATAAATGGFSAWVDFARNVTMSQRAMVFEAGGTGRCLAFDYAAGRIVTATCDQADPRQGFYQEQSGTSTVRLRGADNASCLRPSGTNLSFGCSTPATASERFALRLNSAATAYRIATGTSCVAASGGTVSMRACNNADLAQEFTMRWSTY